MKTIPTPPATWAVCEIDLRVRYIADARTHRAIGRRPFEVLQDAGMLAEVTAEARRVVPLPDPPLCEVAK